jgi:hypothetical protein
VARNEVGRIAVVRWVRDEVEHIVWADHIAAEDDTLVSGVILVGRKIVISSV